MTTDDRVLAACGDEWVTIRALLVRTGLSRSQVDNSVRRLLQRGRVEARTLAGAGRGMPMREWRKRQPGGAA